MNPRPFILTERPSLWNCLLYNGEVSVLDGLLQTDSNTFVLQVYFLIVFYLLVFFPGWFAALDLFPGDGRNLDGFERVVGRGDELLRFEVIVNDFMEIDLPLVVVKIYLNVLLIVDRAFLSLCKTVKTTFRSFVCWCRQPYSVQWDRCWCIARLVVTPFEALQHFTLLIILIIYNEE